MNKQVLKDLSFVVVGNLVLSIGIAFFILPNNILSGGVAGIAIALSAVVPIETTLMINCFTIALFFVGFIILGKGFALKTLVSTILYPSFLWILTTYCSHIVVTSDPTLASLYGGAFVGIGVGLVFRTGASTGGMDIPPLVVNKFTHINLSTLVLITDGLTVLLGMSIHGIEPALIGLLSVFSGAYMVNMTLMMGLSEAKSIMIISDKNDEIYEQISTRVQRGGTMLDAKGAYTNKKKPVLMVIVLKKQFPLASRIIQSIDPNAFVIINDVKEVQGEGFTFNEEQK